MGAGFVQSPKVIDEIANSPFGHSIKSVVINPLCQCAFVAIDVGIYLEPNILLTHNFIEVSYLIPLL